MHPASLPPPTGASARADASTLARVGDRQVLATLLQASRADTLATFAAYEAALPGLQVPLRPELNPPIWELGHIGWFQAWWTTRHPGRQLGDRADPDAPRGPARPPNADALYDSSRIPHDLRWSLPLPDADATRADLAAQLDETMALLQHAPDDHDDTLYAFRLALLHEDMHHEAALYMARGLGLAIDDPRWQPHPLPAPPPPLALPATRLALGHGGAQGFAFDNECGRLEVALDGLRIDAQVLRWAEFLPFAEDGGYADPRWWDEAGRAWLAAGGRQAPRYLRRDGGRWWDWRPRRTPAPLGLDAAIDDDWQPLALDQAAVHLSAHEARAWCRWAGRRLPTEAEWVHAATTAGPAFRWGDAWEWTATPFAPWPGFRPHPYRDYSQPWFDGRPVLRGASPLTQPRLRDLRYRNFFADHRADVPAGFRTVALDER